MKQFKTISSEFIKRYFPPQDERIIAGYVRAIEILSEFIFDTVEEETRIILKDISDDRYEELRQVALGSYSFDVFGTRKSFFDGGDRLDPFHGIRDVISQKLRAYVE